MLHDMDEIDNIEKARAIESIIQSMENFNISIDQLIEKIEFSDLCPLKNPNANNNIDSYLFK
jgi:hypothetical protein